MSKLTEKQIANLISVRDTGQPTPRSRAGYSCRVKGLTEFVWEYTDGAVATCREKPPTEEAWLVKVVSEQLTEAGRAALASLPAGDGKGGVE